MRVLLIEDDEDLGEGISLGLKKHGFEVEWILNGQEGLYHASEWDWDLIILDRLLPELDGMQILRKLRQLKSTPILMLTALNTLDHRLEGFDGGADDYLGKPFELSELLARVNALARRSYGMTLREMSYGRLRFNADTRRVFHVDEEIDLTSAEYRTLEFLLMRKGRIVTRRQLEDVLAEGERDIMPNALEVHIHRLRKKVGAGVIETVRGSGYRIPDQEPEA